MALDASGNFYAPNLNNGTLSEISPNGKITTLALGFNHPYGVAFAPAAVPEPGSVALFVGLAGGGAGLLARRRRTRRY